MTWLREPQENKSFSNIIAPEIGSQTNIQNTLLPSPAMKVIAQFVLQKLTCILMDYDETNPDDCIGRCELPIRDLEPSKTKEYWLDIDMDASLSDAPEANTKVCFFPTLAPTWLLNLPHQSKTPIAEQSRPEPHCWKAPAVWHVFSFHCLTWGCRYQDLEIYGVPTISTGCLESQLLSDRMFVSDSIP